jgi:myo-inositol catabolism protein IolC
MKPGYVKPLYLLPFDHRDSYVRDMFGFQFPLTIDQHKKVVASKQLIYDGFLAALNSKALRSSAGILVDEQFGAEIIKDAIKRNLTSAISVEKSGADEFEFEYGDDFAAHIELFKPTFVKVLVRYNPEGDGDLNERQSAQLLKLSDYCQAHHQHLMFELLVPATRAQLAWYAKDKNVYDRKCRPELMVQAICELQDAGIEPSVWKLEGLDTREDCEKVLEAARRNGRNEVSCIVLGRGADEKKVAEWLTVAAAVPGFIGFAVGRTTFWHAIEAFESTSITREVAVSRIAERFLMWVSIFENAQSGNNGQSNKLIKAAA